MAVSQTLIGARVRRIDVLGERAICIELRTNQQRGCLVCSAERGARGVGWHAERPAAIALDARLLDAQRALRSQLEGSVLRSLSRVGTDLVWLGFERAELRWLALWLRGEGAVVLCDDSGEALCSLGTARGTLTRDASESYEPAETLAELSADGAELVLALSRVALDHAQTRARKAIRGARLRLERRLVAIEADQARHAQADVLRAQANLLLRYAHELPRDAGQVTLLDDMVEPSVERTIQIDAALGPKRQADAWFTRARKLARGLVIAREREAKTRAELLALESLSRDIDSASSLAGLSAFADRGRALGVLLEVTRAGRGQPQARRRAPYREFRGSGDRPIWVGRGAEHNDALTLHHAKPHDLWLHARDVAGAHVVVPLSRGEQCPPDLLCDAATLAAHFSGARGEPGVDVSYVERRYVQKPRRSAAGLVRLVRERVLRLDVEPARLTRLLSAEWLPAGDTDDSV